MDTDSEAVRALVGKQVEASFTKKDGRTRREVGRLELTADGLRVKLIKADPDSFRLISIDRITSIKQQANI
jgi:hypothetical protein